MSLETLSMPEQARALWSAVADAMREGWTEDEWALAGGTLLAMRWDGHRKSTDIDILIHPDSRVSLWPMDPTSTHRLYALDDTLRRHDIQLDRDGSSHTQHNWSEEGRRAGGGTTKRRRRQCRVCSGRCSS